MRKFLALVLALVMTMSLVTVSAGAATDFTDDAKIVNTEAVEVLNAIGILGGYADGSFRPQATLTRGAGAKLIAYLMLGQEKADNLKATYTVFADVTDTVGLAPYIEWAAANGIVDGYGDGNFGPYNTLTEYAFGKMLLTAIGYDADAQGYVGAGWQKAVYRDAIAKDIYTGTESYGACTRDTAAAMTLATLETTYVYYGDKVVNGHLIINGVAYEVDRRVSVTGVYDSELFVWDTYDGLEFDGFAFDTWNNIGDRWTYEGDEIGFYEDEVVVTYTEQTDICDLLVDLGVAANSNKSIDLAISYNGRLGTIYDSNIDTDKDAFYDVQDFDSDDLFVGESLSHDDVEYVCDEHFVGGQGVLTKVFEVGTGEYWATEMATYMAQVTDVDETHKTTVTTFNVGYAVLDLFGTGAWDEDDFSDRDLHTDVFANEEELTVSTDAYDVDEYALVTVAWVLVDGEWELEIVDHEAVEGTVGKLTRSVTDVAAAAGKTEDRVGETYVDGDENKDAFGFRAFGYDAVKAPESVGDKFVFFYDVYGNVIGAEALEDVLTYAVLDAIYSDHTGGKTFLFANVVTLDAVVNKDVNVVEFLGDDADAISTEDITESAKQNKEYAYHLYTYSVSEGDYTLGDAEAFNTEAEVTHVTNAVDCDHLKYYDAETGINEEIQLTEQTQFVLRDVNGNYTALTGYKALKALTAAYAEVIYDDVEATEAAIVYLHDVVFHGDKLIGYIANTEIYDTAELDDTVYYVYDFYVDGVKRELYVEADSDNLEIILDATWGLYEVQFNAVDGKLAVKNVEFQTVEDDTTVTYKWNADGAAIFVDYDNDPAKTNKISFSNGDKDLPIDDAKVFLVDTGDYTVKAGTTKDLKTDYPVELVFDDGALVAVYVLLPRI